MRPKWPEITWSSSSRESGRGLRILGISPWIHDFAAYNLWSRPVGLLACLGMLRQTGCDVALLDCLDPTWQSVPWPRPEKSGRGRYPKEPLSPPSPLKTIPRRYSRYGLPYEMVREALHRQNPPPDLVLVTCSMTYWYPGAVEAMRLVRSLWPRVRIVLGGTYATLCHEHARQLHLADLVLPGPMESIENWHSFWNLLGHSAPPLPRNAGFDLPLDLYPNPGYSPILGSRGCPFSCTYCASKRLYQGFAFAEPDKVLDSIKHEFERGVRDFAFYDDALLVSPERLLLPLLEGIERKKMALRLHAPNALHVRYLTRRICDRLRSAGLATVRLGLETADFNSRPDRKLTREQWEFGARNLLEAGFTTDQIGVYILFGLPHQDSEEIIRTISLARQYGFRPHLAQYTPIPGSALFPEACRTSPFPLDEEPLFQNNSLWPCRPDGFSWEEHQKWKRILSHE